MCCVWYFHTAIPEDMIQEPEPPEDDPEERIPREFNMQGDPFNCMYVHVHVCGEVGFLS